MKRGYAFLLSFLLVVFCFNTSILAQETTGNVEGFVRDEQNNVVSGVSVTIQSKSGTTGFRQIRSLMQMVNLLLLEFLPEFIQSQPAPHQALAP